MLPSWIEKSLGRFLSNGSAATPRERSLDRQAWFQAKAIARRVYRPFTAAVVAEAEQEAVDYLKRRQELHQDFCNRRSAIALAAISEYLASVTPDFYQLHVGQRAGASSRARSFGIDRPSFDYLWCHQLFPRVRYRSGEYIHPAKPIILRAWGEPVSAMLILTTTHIHGRIDSSTFMLLQKRDGQWQNHRAYLLDCAPESLAWQLGHRRFTAESDLPNREILGISRSQADLLVRAHEELLRGTGTVGFRHFSIRSFDSAQKVGRSLKREHEQSDLGPEALVRWMDGLLRSQKEFVR